MILLALAALAGPRPADPALARLSPSLRPLADADPAAIERFLRLAPPRAAADGLSVSVETTGDDDAVAASLIAAGYPVEARAPGVVQVHARWGELRHLTTVPGVTRVREPWRPRPREKVTEGWDATMAVDWHAAGVTGRGVTVGVADLGFDGLDTLTGEIPGDVVTDFDFGGESSSRHGTAVVEVIADFAPEASYVVGTFGTEAEFCTLLTDLVDAGADVINGSIGFDNTWPADGTSVVTQCADAAVEEGALYVAAAGNENDKYRIGELSYADDDGLVAIDGVSDILGATWGGWATVSFRWTEPMSGAAQDLDLFVYEDDGVTLCGASEDHQDGGDDARPYEYVDVTDCSEDVVIRIVSPGGAADLDGLRGYLYDYDGLDPTMITGSENLTLPGDTVGLSVGAYAPASDAIPLYSSRGPTTDGRTKPDLVAPSGVTTQSYGTGGFSGSSAAAPHATGLAALWIDATNRDRHPDELHDWLVANARDLGEEGVDDASGYGALAAGEVPERQCGCAATREMSFAGLLAVALLVRRRR